jgi:sterol 3beta-glucosyltransferase
VQVAIIAPGSRGDVQPYVALGVGLAARGHGVRLVTTLDHASLVREHGLEPWLAEIDIQRELEAPGARDAIEGGGLIASFRRFSDIAKRGSDLVARQALAASEAADVVLAGFGGIFTATAVAEKLGVPLVQAYNVPYTPTAAFPGALTPWLSFPPRGFTHRLGHKVARQAIWLTSRASGNPTRRQIFGLSDAPRLGRFDSGILGASPILYGLSPAVTPRPADWGPRITMTGYWFLDAAPDWRPNGELTEFLAAGPPPVYIGFGSMSSRDPGATAALVLQAIAESGRRAVLHRGWGGLAPTDLPESVLAIDSVPHSWLFPRMAAIVHHGGAGTTAAAIRAGVPAVVVPFHGDQPFWGRLVADKGLAPRAIPRKRLTASRLAAAITTAATDEAMRERAAAVGERVRGEDGVAEAVAAIERVVAR